MRRAVFAIAVGVLATSVAGFGHPAGAVPLVATNSLTINGLLVTITGCHLANASHASASCVSGDNLQLISSGSGSTATVTIESTLVGGNIFDATAGNPHQYDLSVDLTVATIASNTRITSAALAITGSANGGDVHDPDNPPPGDLQLVGGTETILGVGPGNSSAMMTADLSSPTASMTFPSRTLLTISKDFRDIAVAGFGPDNLKLGTISQTYGISQVPEPASIALLLTGLTVIGALRRRSRI